MALYTWKRFPAFLYCIHVYQVNGLVVLNSLENSKQCKKCRKTFPCVRSLYSVHAALHDMSHLKLTWIDCRFMPVRRLKFYTTWVQHRGSPRGLGGTRNMVDFVVGTREQNKKIVGNKGTQNILENSETKPISGKEYEFYYDLTYCK